MLERQRLNGEWTAAVRNWNGHGPKEKTLLDVINNGEALYFASHALIAHLENEDKHRAPYCYSHCMSFTHHLESEIERLRAELAALPPAANTEPTP